MKLKEEQKTLIMSLGALLICFLLFAAFFNVQGSKSLIEEFQKDHTMNSFDYIGWQWTTTEVISTESTDSAEDATISIDIEENVHVAWQDSTDYPSSGTRENILYKRWNATTSSWTTPEVVSTVNSGNSIGPVSVADDKGNVHLAWYDKTDYLSSGTDFDIFYQRWNLSTFSWTTTEVVSTESTEDSYFPSFAVDANDNIYIAWHDYTEYLSTGHHPDIFYKKWNSSLSSWTITELLSTNSLLPAIHPSLGVDQKGNVHVVWENTTMDGGTGLAKNIVYLFWNATSSLWDSIENISPECINSSSRRPSLCIDSKGNIHTSWSEEYNYGSSGTDRDILYKYLNASTHSWSTLEVVSTESVNDSLFCYITTDSEDNIHIAWTDESNFTSSGIDFDIFYKRKEAKSTLWTNTEVISTESTGDSYRPSIDVNSLGNVYVAWDDYSDYNDAGSNADIFYKFLSELPIIPELSLKNLDSSELLLLSNLIIGVLIFFIIPERIRKKTLKN